MNAIHTVVNMKERYDFSRGRQGAIEPMPPGKTRITIRIDDDVLEWFRGEVHAAGGGNYQTSINNALRQYVQDRREPIEEILRRVVREELSTTDRTRVRSRGTERHKTA